LVSGRKENPEESEDDEHVGEVHLVAALTELKERTQNTRGSPVCLRGGCDEQACSDGEKGHIETNSLQAELCGLSREAQDEDQQERTEEGQRPKGLAGDFKSRDHQSREAAEGDGIHAAEIGVFPPDFVAVGEYGSGERPDRDETREQQEQELPPSKQSTNHGEEEIEHLFDGKGPQNVPIAGKIAAPRFEDIDVEGERREQSSSDTTRLCGDHEVLRLGQVKNAEYRQQEKKQRRNARKAHKVEATQADTRECTPAA